MNTAHKIDSYEQQAIDFLEATNTTLEIKYLYTGKHFADDTEARDIYSFVLSNNKHTYSANFGDSLNNTKYNQYVTGKKGLKCKQDYDFCRANNIPVIGERVKPQKKRTPSSYDILACLDVLYCDTFEEFCDEFGYSDQPLKEHDKIMQTYLKCREQSNALKKLFTDEQLEQLAEIC